MIAMHGSRSHPECQLGAGSQREKIQDHSHNLTPKYKADPVLCVDWWLAKFFFTDRSSPHALVKTPF